MANLRVQRRRGERGDDGASLVEFALILPVFTMLLFGMISTGIALNDKQQITHATREGARYAATVPANQIFDNGEDWAVNVRDLVVQRSIDTLEDASVCVSLVTGSASTGDLEVLDGDPQYSTRTISGSPAPCTLDEDYPVSTAAADDGRRVQVTATAPAEIDLVLFGRYTITMSVKATALTEPDS